uniref:IS66 family transposase n=2 Tax=Rhizobium TaxID=379 RepID=UPI0035E45C41
MTGAAAVGAGNNLRGYVSEQIVAARRGRREVDRVKARIVYVAKYWEALKLFLADGRIEIDNNSIERTIARMRSLP